NPQVRKGFRALVGGKKSQPLRPHHGAPQGGPSPRQFVSERPSTTLPRAGRPINWSSSVPSHEGQRTSDLPTTGMYSSKVGGHSGQVYSYNGMAIPPD